MFHSSCRATEASLRATIDDLRDQLQHAYERMDAEREQAHAREKELYDRVLAVNQPHVYQATRDRVPALPASLPSNLVRRGVPPPRPGVGPLLTPSMERPSVPPSNGTPAPTQGPPSAAPQMVDPDTLLGR